jgi:hypothetical protein
VQALSPKAKAKTHTDRNPLNQLFMFVFTDAHNDCESYGTELKKPTVLPRWVFKLLTLNWLAPAGN